VSRKKLEAPEFQVGDSFIRVDHNTTHRPYKSREFNIRVRRGGKVSVYRLEVDQFQVDYLNRQKLAEFLHAWISDNNIEPLFTYIDASD
jgi:hypothetical protein